MKNTKAILVFLCALVMVLTGIGMPKAHAAEVVNDLTVDHIFDSLGAALEYGTVAREWTQGAHAETNACVDVMNRLTNTIFSNTGSTYFHALGYELQADVSAPENPKGMVFALFKQNKDGTDYTMCPGTEQSMAAGVTAATLTWNIGDKDDASVSELKNTRLFVMQVENGTYVKDGAKNEAELIVTYGPSVSASAYNTNYIGKMFYPATKNAETGEYIPPLGEGDSVAVFNTTSYSPGIELGPETRLYYRQDKYNEETGKTEAEYIEIDPNDTTLDIGAVLVNYYYGDETNPSMAYAKLDDIGFKNGAFIKGEDVINISYKQEKGYASTLVSNAAEYAQELANMGGGEITSLTPNANGGSTVVGPKDENGNVVSLYEAEVGADGIFRIKEDMGWAGIPVAENEYVIINVICPSKDGKVLMGTDAADITYFHSEGQTAGEGVQWGGEDSNSSQRVIFNFVYADENGIMRPYEGTVEPTARHGGTLLVPNGKVELIGEVHNGAIIADEVYNGQEIHQRCFAAQARSTWVRMDCGTIWLQKASVGYNWGTGEWEDQSNKAGISLEGAVFGVYSNKNCTEDSLVMTMTTDEKGVATSDLLSAGTYWVKEITPLKDHNLSTDVVEVKVDAGENRKVQGPGYKVKPSNGQQGYEVVKPGAFANQQNNGFTTLRLVKNDEFGNVLPGAEFGVYDADGNLIVSAKSNRNGVVLFENVPLRQTSATDTSVTYTIKEINPPEGYHKNNSTIKVTLNKKDHRDKIVTIDGNGNAAGEAFVNEIIRGDMSLKKQDAVTNMPLPGAEFTIYSDAARTKEVGKMTTGFLPYDTMGYYGAVAVERDLIPGTYYVVETKAPDGYELPYEMVNGQKVDKVYTVEVLPGEMVDVVTGDELESSWWYGIEIPAESYATPIGNTQVITIAGQKIWRDDGDETNRPQRVTIELYKKVAGSTQENFVARTQISGPDWEFEFKTDFNNVKLPRYDENGKEIEYVVKEGRDGLGYYYSFVKQTKDNNGNITVTVANTIKTTKVTGRKVWEDNLEVEKHPEQITFLLFAEMDGELVPINYSYGGQMNATGYRHEGYKFTFDGLPTYDVNGDYVTYVVKEAESDDYYLLDSDSTSTTENNTITVDFTLTNRLTVPLKGTKTWDDGGRTNRPAVELEIKRNDKPFPLTGPDALDGVEVIWDKETNTDVWTWKVVGLPKYDDAGNPYTYTVKEKSMPGYKSEVTTDENGIHFTNTLDGMGRLRLYKMDDEGNWLNGVKFNIYTDESCSADSYYGSATTEKTGSGKNVENGKLTKEVPYGTYYLKEAETVEGYQPNNKVYVVHVFKPIKDASDIENGDMANPKDATNMNVVVNKKAGATTSVTVSKFWYHEGNPDAASINEDVTEALTLYIKKADGSEVEVKDADGKLLRPDTKQDVYDADGKKEHTEYTWNGLPILPDGEEYIVREDTNKLPYGYTVQYSNSALDYTTDGHGLDNRYFSASASFVVFKRMDGKSATEAFKFQLLDKATRNVLQTKENFTIQVMPDGTLPQIPTSATFILQYDGPEHMGKEYEYVIREVGVDGYICDTTEYQVKVAVNADATTTQYLWDEKAQQYVELTVQDMLENNKLTFNNQTATSVTVNKLWPSSEPQDVSDYLFLCTLDAEGKPVKLDPQPEVKYTKDALCYTWSDLPKCDDKGNEIKYAVIEEGLEGYFTTYSEGGYAADGGWIMNTFAWDFFNINKGVMNNTTDDLPADASFNFTITPGEKNPGKCELSKLVDTATGTEEPLKPDEKGIYTVTFVPGEVRSFFVYFPGVAGTYTFDVQEVVPSSLTGIWGYDTHIYTVTFTVNADGTVTKTESDSHDFYNAFYGITNVTITKFWIDENGYVKAENAPNIADKLTLCKLVNGEPKPVENVELPEYTFGDGDLGGVYTWSGLPEYDENGNEIEYVVVEQKMPGYEQLYFDEYGDPIYGGTYAPKGGGIENEWQTTDVYVTKKWVGGPLVDSDIAENLVLLADGVVQTAKPTKEDNMYAWCDLPKYNDEGELIVYTVEERNVPDGYVVSYEPMYIGEDEDQEVAKECAFTDETITNTYKKEEKTSVTINKHWPSSEEQDVSDYLYLCTLDANGKPVKLDPQPDDMPAYETEKTTGGATLHYYTWSDLTKCDAAGNEIKYVVIEEGLEGYFVTYSGDGYAADGGWITNKLAWDFFNITKDVENRTTDDLPAGTSFAFTITPGKNPGKCELRKVEFDTGLETKLTPNEEGVYTVSLAADEWSNFGVYFPVVTGTYTFDVQEVVPSPLPDNWVYDTHTYTVTFEVAKDGTVTMSQSGENDNIFVNIYEEKTYETKGEVEFDGVKVLNGRDLKAGEFTFILTDKNGKELQRVTNAADGTFAFEPIEYTEKDVPYGKEAEFTYYITELAGNLPGVTYDTTKYEIVVGLWDDEAGTIYVGDISECVNEIVFTNTYEAEGSVTFKGAKFLLGREFKQGDEFTFELLNEKGEVIDTVTINPVSGAKADFAFKTIKYELADAGKTYTYTYRVKEKAGSEDGMTYDDTVHTVTVTVSDAGDGSLKVVASDSANKLNFTNTYLAEGSVLFSGTKTMNGKALEGKDFTFVLTDADGKEIETVTNDKDGKIVFSTIQYDLEDAGKTFTYKVSEKNDGKKAVTYDDTVYTVTVKVEDAGNGHLKVTASDNATKLNFTNSYEAKAYLTLNAFKTVNGYKPTVDQVYDFVLLCDDGTEMKAQNKAEEIIFGTIGFDEEDIGKTFIYTVMETTEANELLEVDAAIYQVAVTVVDNGDGNLKLETEFLKDGKRANGVVFANTATATLAISKTVKGPGPDKAFDLKVTFIGVDGKELEGVYDYDGDVKGTITSGGVIALKDGQSVTIVGLPEGATYTVEENAGPAYTVTVNGKPIAKAEGTLVGHGKLEFINTVETTTFSVTKVWEGTDLGAITLTLYADGEQITPQPEVTREGDKYTYYNLPKYNEEGEEIVYSAKERGIDGYIRIYNNVEPYQNVTSVVHDGGTIVNREVEEEVHELSFKIRKVWTGVEATEEIPAITLTLYCNGEKLDVPTPKPNSEGWYRYYDLPKTVNGQIAVYTVIEEPIPGYTVTYKTASGEIVEEGVNGGEIINAKIPQTGDPATLGLWLALMGASAVLLTMLQRRRKA